MATNDAIFMHEDVKELFKYKTVIVLGDSIQRSVYKDLVCLFSDPSSGYVFDHELRAKGELRFRNDRLIQGGVKGEKVNSTNYREEREFREGNSVFRFYFVTRCWNDYVESIVQTDMTSTVRPDVIIMNSCLWDIHHYGEEGKQNYEYFMNKLFTAIFQLPSTPLLVWNSALPLAEFCKGGFLRKGFKTLPAYEVHRGNAIAQRQTQRFNFIYVDLYRSISRHEIFSQADDGIHWSNRAHRNMTNSILAAICHRWRITVPVPLTLLRPTHQQLEWFMPESQLPPPMLTRPAHRYHPYMGLSFLRNRTMRPIVHQRSFTDPFPLSNQYLDYQEVRNSQYKARFMKMNKIKSPGSIPLLTKPADRQPLKESNVEAKTQTSSPAAKTTCNDNTPKQDSPERTYKDCKECSACTVVNDELPVESKEKDCLIHNKSNGKQNVPEKKSYCGRMHIETKEDENGPDDTNNNTGIHDKRKEQDGLDNTYEDCECCGPNAGHGPAINGDTQASQDSSLACESELVASDKKEAKVDNSTDRLVVNDNDDFNNNDNNRNTNEKKRKYENDDDDDEKSLNQPGKISKLA